MRQARAKVKVEFGLETLFKIGSHEAIGMRNPLPYTLDCPDLGSRTLRGNGTSRMAWTRAVHSHGGQSSTYIESADLYDGYLGSWSIGKSIRSSPMLDSPLCYPNHSKVSKSVCNREKR